ncbi:MAG TPA: hypothetical protein VNZ48_15905 [Xanthobacteraceae bacterium]|jgi:hypothetical protein|nr:hypothetical protein [Xanthobacteraceae bacterium]
MSTYGTMPSAPYAGSFRAVNIRQTASFLCLVAVGLLAASPFAVDPIAYMCVTIPVLLAPFLWVSSGAFGIPVLPVISALSYVYYALPLLAGETLAVYRSEDLVWAALSVGLFLTAAALAAWPFLGDGRGRNKPPAAARAPGRAQLIRIRSVNNLAGHEELYRLIFIGLVAGNLYYLLLLSGTAGYLGSFIGVVRSVTVTLGSLACYLTGFARGSGLLTGQRWAAALGGFLLLTLLSMSGLFLVTGAVNIAAAVLGYVLAAKRIPWITLALAFAILSILNAGKLNVRNEYWARDSQSLRNASIVQVPGMVVDWFAAGISAPVSHNAGENNSLLERTSLLHMVLAVQEVTPRIIPYLEGGTYALLPSMLVPRFLQPDKIESQAGLNLLSVRYGRQRAEDTHKTTLGWGIVAEAYANYGNPAVIAVGVIFGALCGFLMRLSATAAPLSLAMLMAIASTLTLCNLELDVSSLVVTMMQTAGGILLFAALPRVVKRRAAPAMPPRSGAP